MTFVGPPQPPAIAGNPPPAARPALPRPSEPTEHIDHPELHDKLEMDEWEMPDIDLGLVLREAFGQVKSNGHKKEEMV
jgi:hypothetical protein